ncbi:expressed unknown protein [Seminavis robusta]|uniref:Uncharacterized protein n=1 Tax=Seminavis robusta TaxID=568900 RepID=A0A9N8HRM5_9STRA|nr:expressed unknown protein [Seminavis robusta]|eukprot:Sro1088_g239930.1 n/a (221) ;mRNA; r:4104-4766
MLRVASTPVLCESHSDCKGCHEQPTKRSISLLKLPKLRLGRRKSSATFDLDHDECSSNRSMEVVERVVGGCLKFPTQAMSVAETYAPPVGLDTRAVSFGSMEVLIFPLTLGDNPAVSVGPPLAMGNELHARLQLSVEQYELTRPARRTKPELAVPKAIREDWLRDEGFARSQWRQMEDELLAIKKSRKASSKGCTSEFFLRLFGTASSSRRPKRTSVLRK